MRRRITVAMVVMVAVSLLLAGAVTLLITIRATRQADRRQLLQEATGLAQAVKKEADRSGPGAPPVTLRDLIGALKNPLRLQDAQILGINADGTLSNPLTPHQPAKLPSHMSVSDLHPDELARMQRISGLSGGVVYAAVPYRATVRVGGRDVQTLEAILLTRRPPTGLAASGPWFLGSAAVIIIVAFVVADRLGRRFMRPVQAIEATTERIAGGDLEARVAQPPGTDPELAALAGAVNTMADSLGRSRRVERQFLLSVSHDLRTPLTSIRGFAEAIEDGTAADPAPAAGIISAEAGRMERLVGDLLDLAKLETRTFSFHLATVDLATVARTTAGGFGPAAGDLGVTLRVDAESPLPAVADPDRLAQVVANLVENALSFARTAVWVGTASIDGQAVLWVDDDGPGIQPADLNRVFERLYSSRPEAGRSLGSGLGLAIVSELVTAMGGSVRAESPIEGGRPGTRMVVTLRSGRPD